MEQSNKNAAGQAVSIGVICIISYLVNYYLRNMLSVLTPQMLTDGRFTVEYIGVMSSTYMIFYAGGQLVNGFLGDRLSPKKMACTGIALGSLVMALFPFATGKLLQVGCFALLGFFLSMVRGPLTKIISENTRPDHARTICVFFSMASFAGPLVASLLAFLFAWETAFAVAGCVGLLVALAALLLLTGMEKQGRIHYKSAKGQGLKGFFGVFQVEHIGFYAVIACLVEIVATPVSFWIPTYLTDHLGFQKDTANVIYSVLSVFRSMMPFATLLIFRLSGERDRLMMKLSFLVATAAFLLLGFVDSPCLSIVLLAVGVVSAACPSALLWSIYIPALGRTGKVSSLNGVLDCTGYVAAAVANLAFAGMMQAFGWRGMFALWSLVALIGVIAVFAAKTKKQ